MPRLVIYGAGDFGCELLLPLRQIDPDRLPGPVAFLDDASAATEHAGVPVLRFEDARAGDRYLVAVQNSRVRQRLDAKCREAGLLPFSLIAPSSQIGPSVSFGDACLINLGVTITGFSTIGNQVHIGPSSFVGHDCVIGDYVTFDPGVECCGHVHVESHACIGANAVIRNGTAEKPLLIGEGSVVGCGAVVTRDVPAFSTVVGNPAILHDR